MVSPFVLHHSHLMHIGEKQKAQLPAHVGVVHCEVVLELGYGHPLLELILHDLLALIR